MVKVLVGVMVKVLVGVGAKVGAGATAGVRLKRARVEGGCLLGDSSPIRRTIRNGCKGRRSAASLRGMQARGGATWGGSSQGQDTAVGPPIQFTLRTSLSRFTFLPYSSTIFAPFTQVVNPCNSNAESSSHGCYLRCNLFHPPSTSSLFTFAHHTVFSPPATHSFSGQCVSRTVVFPPSCLSPVSSSAADPRAVHI